MTDISTCTCLGDVPMRNIECRADGYFCKVCGFALKCEECDEPATYLAVGRWILACDEHRQIAEDRNSITDY